jgi:hypothetical protein
LVNSPHELGFDYCGDIPCFLNIVPGVTTIEMAIELLKNKSITYHLTGSHRKYFTLHKVSCAIIVIPNNLTVAGLEISINYASGNPQPQIILHEFIEMFGEPCVVWVSRSGADKHFPKIAFEYPLNRVFCQDIIDEDDDKSISDALVTYILLAAPELVGHGMTPNPCDAINNPENHCVAWRGYLSVNEYRSFVWQSD